MELGMIITFAIFIAVCIFVSIDQYRQEQELGTLGEEWDFTKPFNHKKS